jgi:hypothetical protein
MDVVVFIGRWSLAVRVASRESNAIKEESATFEESFGRSTTIYRSTTT